MRAKVQPFTARDVHLFDANDNGDQESPFANPINTRPLTDPGRHRSSVTGEGDHYDEYDDDEKDLPPVIVDSLFVETTTKTYHQHPNEPTTTAPHPFPPPPAGAPGHETYSDSAAAGEWPRVTATVWSSGSGGHGGDANPLRDTEPLWPRRRQAAQPQPAPKYHFPRIVNKGARHAGGLSSILMIFSLITYAMRQRWLEQS
jgi:hypothetical protein